MRVVVVGMNTNLERCYLRQATLAIHPIKTQRGVMHLDSGVAATNSCFPSHHQRNTGRTFYHDSRGKSLGLRGTTSMMDTEQADRGARQDSCDSRLAPYYKALLVSLPRSTGHL